MGKTHAKLTECDPVWQQITTEAEAAVMDEPLLGGLVHSSILHHKTLESALAYRMSMKLASSEMPEQILREICDSAYRGDPELGIAARADIVAVYDRDPACDRYILPLLFSRGFRRCRPTVLGIGCGARGGVI